MRLGRVLLSYGIVLLIGLWAGYKIASTRKAAPPGSKEMLDSIATVGNEQEEKGSEGADEAGEKPSLEGEVVQRDDLSLTFYEKLLKKEPPPKMRGKQSSSKESQAATAPKKSPSEGERSSLKSVSRDGPFTVQVGSFARREQAENLAQHLKGKGYVAYVTSQVISGMGRMYRVRIGHYQTLDEAEREAKHIRKREKLPTYIPPLPDR
ncbi:MAG: SPOR domain-containing protein [Deltaproteobacteria bacterium]|nr:SPOR domain-containing protein [Deltaproteobacteria bacterium]